MRRAVYAGTFDPITNGHLDILTRATHLFDEVVIAVAHNPQKHPMFSVAERVAFIAEALEPEARVRVDSFDGLLVDYARAQGAIAIVRGLRAVSDFEFEFQMTQMNRDLDPGIETLFLMPNEDYFFTSSSLVKQVAKYASPRIRKFVPPHVAAALEARQR